MSFRLFALLLALSFCGSSHVSADNVIDPGTIYSNSFSPLQTGQSGFEVDNIVNGSGILGGFSYDSGVSDFQDVLTLSHSADLSASGVENISFGGRFVSISGTQLPGVLRFDLGSEQSLTGLAIWNMGIDTQLDRSGMNQFSIRVSDSSNFLSATNVTFLGGSSVESAAAATGPTSSGQEFNFNEVYAARYVEMQILNSHLRNDTVFVGEVVFSVVPEPGSFLFLGSTAIVFLGRRRRATARK